MKPSPDVLGLIYYYYTSNFKE